MGHSILTSVPSFESIPSFESVCTACEEAGTTNTFTRVGPNVSLDPNDKVIRVRERRTVQDLYSYLMNWCDEADNMDMDIPMLAITDHAYEMENGWLIDDDSFEYLHGGSIQNGDDLYVGMIAVYAGDEPTPTGVQQNDGPIQELDAAGDLIKLLEDTTELNFVNLRLNQRYFKAEWVPTGGNFVYPAMDMWDLHPLEETYEYVLEGQKRRIERLGEV